MATVRKVFRLTYVGTDKRAPRTLDVPSQNQSGWPTIAEIKAALEKLGYDSAVAQTLANDGSHLRWKQD